MKKQKGITLIALIITIVVLLILAVVTIGAVKEGGIIEHANNAANKYEEAKEKELVALAYSEYIMEKQTSGSATLEVEGATVTGNETDGWSIMFSDTKSEYKLDSTGIVYGVNDWVAAWICDGTSWSTKIENKGDGVQPTGKIVAKLYDTGNKIIPGEGMPEDSEYHLFIEGSGNMAPTMKSDFSEGYAWLEDYIEFASGNKTTFTSPYITKVVIEEGITGIGDMAFALTSLTNITIPNSVTSIGAQSFVCSKLTSITIPSNVTYIGEGAFNSTGLLKVKILSTSLTAGDDCFDANPSDCKIYVLSDIIKTELSNDIATGNIIIVVTEEEMNEI